MHWLQTLDVELFRFVNLRLINPVFDAVMPLVSGNALFVPVVLLVAILLVWKGRARGALCVLMLTLTVSLGDGLVCNTLKHALERPRPYAVLPDVHRPGSNSTGQYRPPMSREGAPELAAL